MTQFKDALEAMNPSNDPQLYFSKNIFQRAKCGNINGVYWLTQEEANTIRRALLIADKISQFPSEKMTEQGVDKALFCRNLGMHFGGDPNVDIINYAFTAMRDQLIKEVEEELQK